MIAMRTNIVLDDKLVEECQKLTGIKTKKDLINFALIELKKKQSQRKLLQLQGVINWEGNLDEWRQNR